jgi:hypothetical protein
MIFERKVDLASKNDSIWKCKRNGKLWNICVALSSHLKETKKNGTYNGGKRICIAII